jgi:hypothetical protein
VYYGLSTAASQAEVAAGLMPRRGALYPPGMVSMAPGSARPLVYLAVRDPSSVRVKPARNGHRHRRDADHVSLVIRADRPRAEKIGHPEVRRLRAWADAPSAFVVTVGLRHDREVEFHQRVVLDHPGLAYAELCEVITALKDRFAD